MGEPRSADAYNYIPALRKSSFELAIIVQTRRALRSNRAQGTNLTIVIMKKVKIEFNYPEQGEHGTTFSLTIDNMDVKSAEALERLPEMIERQYEEYLLLVYGCPNLPGKQHPTSSYEAPQGIGNKSCRQTFADGQKDGQGTQNGTSLLSEERCAKGTGFDEIPEASKMRLSNKFPDGTYLARVPPYVAIYIPQGFYETFRMQTDYHPCEIDNPGPLGRNGADFL